LRRVPNAKSPFSGLTLVKPAESPDGSQSIALCWSEGRTQKDRAIRQKHEVRFPADTEKLAKRIALGRLRTTAKIYEAIGRLKERYPPRGSLLSACLRRAAGPTLLP